MGLPELLLILAVVLIIFLVCREFWCWYFKLTKIASQLEKLNQQFEQFLKQFEAPKK